MTLEEILKNHFGLDKNYDIFDSTQQKKWDKAYYKLIACIWDLSELVNIDAEKIERDLDRINAQDC